MQDYVKISLSAGKPETDVVILEYPVPPGISGPLQSLNNLVILVQLHGGEGTSAVYDQSIVQLLDRADIAGICYRNPFYELVGTLFFIYKVLDIVGFLPFGAAVSPGIIIVL